MKDNVNVAYNFVIQTTNLNLQLFNMKKINIFAHYVFLGLGS